MLATKNICSGFRHGQIPRDARGAMRAVAVFAAATLALVAAMFSFAPADVARAQALAHCDSNDKFEVWCASLTVGTRTDGGDTFYGFRHVGTVGSLSPMSFTYRRAQIFVNVVEYEDGGDLFFDVLWGSGETHADGMFGTRDYLLEIGTGVSKKSFLIKSPRNTSGFYFSDHGLSWSSGDTVPVRLVFVNYPATGRPSVYGLPRVDRPVFNSLDPVSDGNGMDFLGSDPVVREYQWIRVDGQSERDIPGATWFYYRTRPLDQDRQLKVRVTFTDLDGYREVVESAPWPEGKKIERRSNRPWDVATGDVLTSNRFVPNGAKVNASDDHAQGFRTGSNASGYTLTGVSVEIAQGGGGNAFDMKLCTAQSTSPYRPTTDCTQLSRPADYRGGTRSFTPSAAMHLNPNTRYVAVVEVDSGRPTKLHSAKVSFAKDGSSQGSEDRDNRRGWSIMDNYFWLQGGSWRIASNDNPIMIVVSGYDGAPRQVAVDPPTVSETPGVSDAGPDGEWTEGETVEVTLTFSEAVDVDTTGGTPSIEVSLGGTKARSASYVRGTGTTGLVFAYTLVSGDGSHTSMSVAPDSLALNGGTIRSKETDADATLTHNGAAVAAGLRDLREAKGVSGSDFTVAEGATAVTDLSDTDTTCSIPSGSGGGADADKFGITTACALSFTSTKDFEHPDDANGDGVYQVTVRLSEGKDSSTTDLTVTLSDVNEAPTANAGADQTGVTEGATVTLSGTGTDPDHVDTLTYAWSQTGTPAVTLSDAAVASPTFTAPTGLTEDTTLTFTLRVTDAGGLFDEDTVSVTVARATPPLTAEFQQMPAGHNGSGTITFRLRFSETPKEGFSYTTLRDHAFTVTGGSVTGARRLEPPSNVGWEITVEPDGNGAVTIVLPETADCSDDGAVCTADGRKLSNRIELTVPGPSNTPAAGAPTISGTAQVGRTLTADTSGISDSDGLTNASFSYRWVRSDGASHADIQDATGSSYTLVDADQGKTIKVRVTFTDDAGNEESLTSTATAAVAPRPPLTASFLDAPASHDGQTHFTFELRFSEAPVDDFSYLTLRDYAFTVTGGEVIEARRLERPANIKWEIKVQPDGDGAVTIVLPATSDCSDDGAVCTANGRKLSNRTELTVNGPG